MAKGFAYSVGLVYVVLGAVGFGPTGFEQWLEADTGDHLIWFQLNPTQNFLHLVLGVVLLWSATEPPARARAVVLLIGLVFGALGVAGFFLTGRPDSNVLALNLADNLLHLATGAAAIVVAARPVVASART
ncbi:MAG TPA: DUF4383 domain-containing protein [Nitriliruptorales bacterium]|nr:DUF4383 domain-containing protein [Nitriliruptorales bacterium]